MIFVESKEEPYTSPLISDPRHKIGNSQYWVSAMKTPGFASAPCYIAGIFRPQPGSRHIKPKKRQILCCGTDISVVVSDTHHNLKHTCELCNKRSIFARFVREHGAAQTQPPCTFVIIHAVPAPLCPPSGCAPP